MTRYIVTNNRDIKFEKLYDEPLEEGEISQLVRAEIKQHKEAIEKAIREANDRL